MNRKGGPFKSYPERIVGSLMVSKELDAELSDLILVSTYMNVFCCLQPAIYGVVIRG